MLFRKETPIAIAAAQLWTHLIRRTILVRVRVEIHLIRRTILVRVRVELYTYLIRRIVILVRVKVVSTLQP